MKILLSVNSSWNVINFRSGLIKKFLAHGHEVVVVAPQDQYSGQVVDLGCRYVGISLDQKGMSIWEDFKLLLYYCRVIALERPDVYLGYTVKPNIYGSLACRILRVPVINNIAGLGTAFINGGLLSKLVSFLYKISIGSSFCVFFQNSDDYGEFIESGIIRQRQARLLPGSGVDLTKYRAPAYVPRESEVTHFLFIGRLLKDKGVVELVEATKMVQANFPNVVVQLLGPVGVENRSSLSLEEVQQWEREGLIEYLGVQDDVSEAIVNADVVVLPSYREGTPRVLLEAGALARPLIATDVPGCRQVVEHGSNGLLCQARNSEDLAAKMFEMITLSADEKICMSRACRKKIEEEYDERIVFEKYLEALADAPI